MGALAKWGRWLYHSIFTRTLLILIISAFAVNLWRVSEMYGILYNDTITTVTAQQRAMAQDVANDIAQDVALRESLLRQLAGTLPAAMLEQPEALRQWLQERQALLPRLFDGFVVERSDGSRLAAYPPGQQGFEAAEVAEATAVQIGTVARLPALSVRVVLPLTGRHQGAQLRGLSQLASPGFLDTVRMHSNGKNGGSILLFPRERLIWTVSESVTRLEALPASVLLEQALTGIQPVGVTATPDGQAVLSGHAGVTGTDWSVVAYMPITEAFLPFEHWIGLLRNTAPYVVLYFVLVVMVGTFVVLRPVWRTARLADQMSRGETPLLRLPVGRPDEFGALTAAFNRMLDRLEGQSMELILQKERAEAADLAKSRFLAAASHDLRQPMHALNLYLGALSHLELPGAALAVMASARECAQTMDEMFRALLDISKLDASVMQPSISVFAIAPLLEKIRTNFIQQAHAKGLVLHVAPCSAWVSSDPELLERVLSNLVSNAVRYTEKGRILLGCRRTGSSLRLGVYDTGLGIALDQQRAVFDEFYQVGNAARDRAQGLGLGLGLAIVQRLAALLQAPVALSSQPGRGSVFSIEVSRAQRQLIQPPAAAVSFRRQHGNLKGALIAVIDDEPLVRDATALLLRQWGCVVVTGESGADAIERLSPSDRVPDAIVCDHRLQGSETGVEVIAALRMEFNSEIPAILITGDTSPQRIQAIQVAGIPVLHKPLQDHVLMDALQGLLIHPPMA